MQPLKELPANLKEPPMIFGARGGRTLSPEEYAECVIEMRRKLNPNPSNNPQNIEAVTNTAASSDSGFDPSNFLTGTFLLGAFLGCLYYFRYDILDLCECFIKEKTLDQLRHDRKVAEALLQKKQLLQEQFQKEQLLIKEHEDFITKYIAPTQNDTRTR